MKGKFLQIPSKLAHHHHSQSQSKFPWRQSTIPNAESTIPNAESTIPNAAAQREHFGHTVERSDLCRENPNPAACQQPPAERDVAGAAHLGQCLTWTTQRGQAEDQQRCRNFT
ncbi:hypothetical protein EK904_007682 [Melospiza melodia maxima]|nr:hypothetical protein EK904_007682 [Melospiza melodia maxima]